MPESPFPPQERDRHLPAWGSTVWLHCSTYVLSSCLSSWVHSGICQWERKASRAQRGMETEFLQDAPLRSTSNNSFQLEKGLEICQKRFQHPSLPLICFLRGMEVSAVRRWCAPCWSAHWAARSLRRKGPPVTELGINSLEIFLFVGN